MEERLYLFKSEEVGYTVARGQSPECSFHVDLDPLDPEDEGAIIYCNKLKEAIGGFREEDELRVTFVLASNATKPVHLKVSEGSGGGRSTFARIVTLLGMDALKVKLRVTSLKNLETAEQCRDLITKDMPVFPDPATGGMTYCAVEDDLEEAYSIRDWFKVDSYIRLQAVYTIELAIKLEFDVISGNNAVITASAACDSRSAFKKMLEDKIGADVEIVFNDGAVLKCHWAFLCGHSPVFQAMYENDMEESRNNRIEMDDISEHTLKAFLAYLYYWETKDACGDPSMAIELLKAANKYQVGCFERTVRSILMVKPDSWYTIDSALELFLIARLSDDQLRDKAVGVLKSISTPSTLEGSAGFKRISNKPEILVDLLKSVLFTKDAVVPSQHMESGFALVN